MAQDVYEAQKKQRKDALSKAAKEKKPPSEWKIKREALEKQFLAVEGSLDAPERQALWPELAVANTGEGVLGTGQHLQPLQARSTGQNVLLPVPDLLRGQTEGGVGITGRHPWEAPTGLLYWGE